MLLGGDSAAELRGGVGVGEGDFVRAGSHELPLCQSSSVHTSQAVSPVHLTAWQISEACPKEPAFLLEQSSPAAWASSMAETQQPPLSAAVLASVKKS